MPFCQECGSEIQTNWKFCPNCNSSIQGKVIVQDGVIAGDVNISENTTNITNVGSSEIKCPQCSTTGNITLHLCITPRCHKKICNLCREQNRLLGRTSGVCNICVQTKLDNQKRELDNQKREENERQERAEQIYLDSLNPKEINKRNSRQERKANALEKRENHHIWLNNKASMMGKWGIGMLILGLIGLGVKMVFPNFLVAPNGDGKTNALFQLSIAGLFFLFIYFLYWLFHSEDDRDDLSRIEEEEKKEKKRIHKIYEKLK